MTTKEEMTLDVEQHIDVKAAIGDGFRSVLHRLGEGNTTPKGESLEMILEEWPCGRWFRDRGNGVGHLWGHVQVLKPPVLIELSGPMFMSYPAINHLEVRLTEVTAGVKVTLRHRAIGWLEPAHRANISTGWQNLLDLVAKDLSPKAAAIKA